MRLVLEYLLLSYHFPIPRIAGVHFSCELSTSLLSCMTYYSHSRGSKAVLLLELRSFLGLILTPELLHHDRFVTCLFISFVVANMRLQFFIEHSTICGLSPTDFIVVSTLSEYFINFDFLIHSSIMATFSLFKSFLSVLSQSFLYVFRLLQVESSSGTFRLLRLTQRLPLLTANSVSMSFRETDSLNSFTDITRLSFIFMTTLRALFSTALIFSISVFFRDAGFKAV